MSAWVGAILGPAGRDPDMASDDVPLRGTFSRRSVRQLPILCLQGQEQPSKRRALELMVSSDAGFKPRLAFKLHLGVL